MAWEPIEKGEDNFDVLVIGAGIAGVNFGYRLQERCPNLSYAILEGRHELGGTWSLFKYPGIRSDSDLYTFGFPWRPWKENTSIAQGGLIKNYIKDSARISGVDKHIHFQTKVNAAAWSSDSKTWTLDATYNGKQPKTYKCRWVLICTGYYDYEVPLQAQIPGIEDFKGQVIHPQFWPEDYDYSNKDVVVIGSGATAITVLPVMAEKAKSVTMLQRSPSYIMAVPSEDGIEWFLRTCMWWFPAFQNWALRVKWILAPLLLTTLSARFPAMVKRTLQRITTAQLPKNLPIDPHFTPKYNPWEQRMCMCPDGDFFKALRGGKANVETGVIENITKDTIKLSSGKELHPDCIVTATGLKLKFFGGIQMTIDGKKYDPAQHFVWKGMMLENLPNVSFVMGYVDASWTLGADATAQLQTRIINQMAKEGVVTVIPRQSADDQAHMKEKSILKLNSTYVEKGKHQLPKAGSRGQWAPRSTYLSDIWNAWYGDIKGSAEWVSA